MTNLVSQKPPTTEKSLEATLSGSVGAAWAALTWTVSANTLSGTAAATSTFTPDKTGYYNVAARWRGTWGAQPDRSLGLYARLLVNGVQQDADDADAGGGANGTSTEVSLLWHGLVTAGQAVTIELYKMTQDLTYVSSKVTIEFVPVLEHANLV